LETFDEATLGLIQRSAIALGFFDGVHPGHQVVIGTAVAEAKRQNLTAAVVTFKDHPRTLTQGSPPLLLTVIDQRLALFEKLGVQAALILDFTEELCRLTPSQYVKNILVASMGAKLISVGYNHHFGRDREGNPHLLAKFGKSMGFSVMVSAPVFSDGAEVSSSRIREALMRGDIEIANNLLSRPYEIAGTVVAGEARGRTIGVPTANLLTEEFQVMPAQGVYAGKARLPNGDALPAVINIGVRPTFTTSAGQTVTKSLVEVHIFNFDQDIYGQKLTVSFYKYLRAEKKFDSVSQLKTQIQSDCQSAKQYFEATSGPQKRTTTAEPESKLPA
jgi:riboflavin kinase / FMN adenylyltransferase